MSDFICTVCGRLVADRDEFWRVDGGVAHDRCLTPEQRRTLALEAEIADLRSKHRRTARGY